MEVKIQCTCGQPFEFEVEPVNGQMPCDINCPSCGTSATTIANEYIAQHQLESPSKPKPSLRLAAAPAAERPPVSSVPPPAPAPIAPLHRAVQSGGTSASAESRDPFLKGVIGALVAGFIGMMGWFLLIKATGYEIGFAAWGVGALTGVGARMLGGEGSKKLGAVAGVFALVAIIGGQYLALRSIAMKEVDKIAAMAYEAQVENAKAFAVASSDADLKAIYAKQNGEEVAEVKQGEWEEFQKTDLPKLKDLAAGKPSEAEFIRDFHKETISFADEFEMLKASFGLFTLLWIFLGVGSAYKLGAGSGD